MAEAAVETGKRGRKAAIKAAKEAEAEPKPDPKQKRKAAKGIEGGPTFWDKVAAVAKPDWGPRANIYLYRVEPVIDRRRAGNQTYITKYAEPISEDRILADHGSGRYKLMLNFRKPGAEQGDEVDSLYLDLLNLQFPPKIPPGEWVDDPNNKKWAWAKQSMGKEAPQNDGGSNLVAALDVLNEIQDSTTKRVMANLPPPTSGADEVVKIAKVLDVIRPPAPPAPPPDNSLATFMAAELASIRAQVEKGRERELALIEKLMDAKSKPSENGNSINLVKEVVTGLKDLLPEVKGIFPAEEGVGRQRPWWQEVALLVAPYAGQFISPLGQVLAAGLANKMMQPQNGQQPNPGQPPAQLPPAGIAGPSMMPFLQMIAVPMVAHIRFLAPPENADPAELGKEFALWVWNGYGSDSRYSQAIVAARAMGAGGILTAFRGTPLWNDKGPQNTLASLAELEPKLPAFFTAFLNFNPDEDGAGDEPEETDPARPVIVETFSEGSATGY